MNGGLRVETCNSTCELGHDLIDRKTIFFIDEQRPTKRHPRLPGLRWIRVRCFLNGVAFVFARLFLRQRSVIAQSVEPLRAVHVARALSSTLIVGSRALTHASLPGNVFWKSFC